MRLASAMNNFLGEILNLCLKGIYHTICPCVDWFLLEGSVWPVAEYKRVRIGSYRIVPEKKSGGSDK